MATPLRYFNRSARIQRIFFSILFIYAVWNPSPFSIGYGSYKAVDYLFGVNDPFWSWIGIGFLGLVVLLIAVFAFRRARLAWSQANKFLCSLYTAIVVGLLCMAILVVGRFFNFEDLEYYTSVLWLWQIPVGFFIGMGLSWSIVDRQLSGIYATNDVELDESA